MSNPITPLTKDQTPTPDNDGVDHINVWSRGATQLGRELSNFAHMAINHPEFGFFASMEAYWYWVGTGMTHNSLRRLYGATAKSAGIRFLPVQIPDAVFKEHICDGLKLKVMQNKKLREALVKSTLPLRHYFVYGSNPPIIRGDKKHEWQMDCLEQIRLDLQNDQPILLGDGRPAKGMNIPEVVENPVSERDTSLAPAL